MRYRSLDGYRVYASTVFRSNLCDFEEFRDKFLISSKIYAKCSMVQSTNSAAQAPFWHIFAVIVPRIVLWAKQSDAQSQCIQFSIGILRIAEARSQHTTNGN